MDHRKVAEVVVRAVGQDNLQAAAHCATRLRLVLKDSSLVNQALLEQEDAVKGTFEVNGQYQIIIGTGDVNKVYQELVSLTGIGEASTEDLKEISQNNGKRNYFMDFVKVLSDIFVPIVPALVAGGLLMAINNVLTSAGLFGAKSVVQMFPAIADFAAIINLIASAPFAFLPILVGFSATKRFGGNPYLGAAMAMAMVMPSLVNGYQVATSIADGNMHYWHIFGLEVAQAGYQGSVIPVLAVAWILATLEKFFHKKMPAALDFTFTPMLAIIITGFLTFVLVGPVMRGISDGMTSGLTWLYQTTGWFGLGIFGLFYSPIVITGLHQSFPAIETTLIANVAKTGGSFIFPIAAMANIAQGGAAFAIMVLSKNEKQKSLASSSGLSALLGITEPAIFGVNLKLKFPFLCAMIASGVASAILGLFHVLAVAMGSAGVIGFISIPVQSWLGFFCGALVSGLLAFSLTLIYGRKKLIEPNREEKPNQVAREINGNPTNAAVGDELVHAVMEGTIVPLKEVADPMFAAELMGKGVAIDATQQEIVAPVTGVVTVVYATKHAYGFQSDAGAEVLIHVGINTVELNGEGFSTQVEQGQRVEQGQVVGTVDLDFIREKGYDPIVMEIITNTLAYAEVNSIVQADTRVTPETTVLALTQPVSEQ